MKTTSTRPAHTSDDDLHAFVKTHMPKTWESCKDRIATAQKEIGASFPDRESHQRFESRILRHLRNQIMWKASVELDARNADLKVRFEEATNAFHARIEALYGSRFVVMEIPLQGLTGTLVPGAHQPSDTKAAEVVQRRNKTYLRWWSNYLMDELAPAFEREASQAFLERYKGEGASWVRRAKAAIEFNVRQWTLARPDYALGVALVNLVDYTRQFGRPRAKPTGRSTRRVSVEAAAGLVACVYAAYFHFVSLHAPEPWEPESESLAVQYRKARKRHRELAWRGFSEPFMPKES